MQCNTRYIVIDNGENCAECDALAGKIFKISEAQIGVNCPPFHPNCDGMIAVLDKDGKPAEVLGTSAELPEASEIAKLLAEALRSAGLIDDDTAQSGTNEQGPSVLSGFSGYEKLLNSSVGTQVSSDWDKNIEELADYLKKSVNQVVLGNYTDDMTMLGTAGQIALGILGADAVRDVRDFIYDITHWEWSFGHIMQTVLDLVAVVPIIGSFKYGDEIAVVLKKVIGNIVEFLKKSKIVDTLLNSKIMKLLTDMLDELPANGRARLVTAGGPDFDVGDYLKRSKKNADDFNDFAKSKMLKNMDDTSDVSKKIDDIADNADYSKNAKKTESLNGSNKSNKKAKADKPFVKNHFDKNGKLKSNVRYKAGEFDYFYETDEYGRICSWETDNLQFTKRTERLKHDPHTPGKEPGDHAGHLVADMFGGSPYLDNLVSQAKNVNLSKYKELENKWAKALREGKKVTVSVDIKYTGDALRPKSFMVKYSIDGKNFRKTISNK